MLSVSFFRPMPSTRTASGSTRGPACTRSRGKTRR